MEWRLSVNSSAPKRLPIVRVEPKKPKPLSTVEIIASIANRRKHNSMQRNELIISARDRASLIACQHFRDGFRCGHIRASGFL